MTHAELMIQTAETLRAWWDAKAKGEPLPLMEFRPRTSTIWHPRCLDAPWGDIRDGYYRIAQPKVVKTVPLGPEDFPPGVTYSLQRPEWHKHSSVDVVGRDTAGVTVFSGGFMIRVTYEDLMTDWQRWGHAAEEWVPCSKKVEG